MLLLLPPRMFVLRERENIKKKTLRVSYLYMLCEVVGPPRVSYCWANNMGFLTLIALFSDFCGPHVKKKKPNLPRRKKKSIVLK